MHDIIDRRKSLIVIFLLLLSSGCIPFTKYETPLAKGRVIDAITKQPIEGVKIMFKEYPETLGYTNAKGYFDIGIRKTIWLPPLPIDPIIPVGTLLIEAQGYEQLELKDQRRFSPHDPIELKKSP